MSRDLDEAHRLAALGKHERALQAARLAAAREPRNAQAHQLAVVMCVNLGRPEVALLHSEALVRNLPDRADVLAAHAALLSMLGRPGEGADMARRALAHDPTNLAAASNLASSLVDAGMPGQALAAADAAIALAPGDPTILNTRAMALHLLGHADEAGAEIDRLLALDPSHANALACQASFRLYDTDDPTPIRAAHDRFAAQFPPRPAPPMPALDGRPRVGFISPDLREHSIAWFLEPLLANLGGLDVHVYHTGRVADAVTRRLRGLVPHWRDLTARDAHAQAQTIARDRLHALVELSGLTTGHSLPALALRPAPLQISWLGYAGSTRCSFIDAPIADGLTDPSDGATHADERVLRVDPCFLCYGPPVAVPLPARSVDARRIRFGCFGSLAKTSDHALRLWASVLAAVPGSVLVLKAPALEDATARADLLARLANAGVEPARVAFLPRSPDTASHLATYAQVDIALDSFPYHGTTTTCEALHMGVPVISRVGRSHAARVGLSLLSCVGLADLAVDGEAEFVRAARSLAHEPARLAVLHATLRDRLAACPLTDAKGHAARFAALLEREIAARAPARRD